MGGIGHASLWRRVGLHGHCGHSLATMCPYRYFGRSLVVVVVLFGVDASALKNKNNINEVNYDDHCCSGRRNSPSLMLLAFFHTDVVVVVVQRVSGRQQILSINSLQSESDWSE